MATIIETVPQQGQRDYLFDNGVDVSILDLGVWEWYDEPNDAYYSGCFFVEDDTVIDYDGIDDLPQEVKTALEESGYKLDL